MAQNSTLTQSLVLSVSLLTKNSISLVHMAISQPFKLPNILNIQITIRLISMNMLVKHQVYLHLQVEKSLQVLHQAKHLNQVFQVIL